MNILVINAGSSSLKYQLMDPETGVVTAKGLCERIGLDGRLTHKVPAKDKKVEREISMPTHAEAIAAVLEILVDSENGVIASTDEIDAVGHRVLHGGDQFIDSCIIDEACKQAIRDCIPLGPLHNPANLFGIQLLHAVHILLILHLGQIQILHGVAHIKRHLGHIKLRVEKLLLIIVHSILPIDNFAISYAVRAHRVTAPDSLTRPINPDPTGAPSYWS